jgi:3-hydroxy-9,10-secoandrosta-1,3,5(10)-triene-9,17-dione monooxygenase reductase component
MEAEQEPAAAASAARGRSCSGPGATGDQGQPGDGTEVEVDPAHFREVLGHFSTGVVVVTAMHDGTPVGMSAQSVVSLSLEPPLVLFCPARSSTTWPRIHETGRFAVNILAADQEPLSVAFARSGTDKFAGVAWEPGHTGAPLLAGALGHVECTLEHVYDGGDHEIVVGRVVDLAVRRDSSPLIFFRGAYASL